MGFKNRIEKLFSRNLSTKGIPKAIKDRVREIYSDPKVPHEGVPFLEVPVITLIKMLHPNDQALINKYGQVWVDNEDFDFIDRRTNKLFGDLTKDNFEAPLIIDEGSKITVASGLHRIALAKICGLQTIKVLMVVTKL